MACTEFPEACNYSAVLHKNFLHRILHNKTKSMRSADRKSFMSLSEIWFKLNHFSRNLQPFNKFLWIFIAMNLSKLEKCRKWSKISFMFSRKVQLLLQRYHTNQTISTILKWVIKNILKYFPKRSWKLECTGRK